MHVITTAASLPHADTLLCPIIIISVLPKGRSFTAHSGTKAAILPKGSSSIANQEPRL